MSCLIPLALTADCPSKRYSVYYPDSEEIVQRLKSMPPAQGRKSRQLQTQPRKKESKRPSSYERKTPGIPRTNMEWISALGEIKRNYMNRRFSQCSVRCHEILDHGDRLDTAHPVHLVYLRFYAATSLEMQARAMHHSSLHRTTLLKQAHAHYRVASDLARQADEDMSRPSSRLTASRLRSPSGSDGSSDSTASTRMSSPAPSLASLISLDGTPPNNSNNNNNKCRTKKRVAFCDEPIIRPDSPTLGFDEWLGRSSPEPSPYPPESILKTTTTTVKSVVTTTALPPLMGDIPSSPEPPSSEAEDAADDPFFHTRSIHRFCSILDSIRRQISAHLASIDAEIAADRGSMFPAAAQQEQQLISPEMKVLDIKARIERLRASGWKRPRFDAQRYETLRENALAEMAE